MRQKHFFVIILILLAAPLAVADDSDGSCPLGCPAGEVCGIGGFCILPCSGDSDCPLGESCWQTGFQPFCGPTGCTTNSDCPTGMVCGGIFCQEGTGTTVTGTSAPEAESITGEPRRPEQNTNLIATGNNVYLCGEQYALPTSQTLGIERPICSRQATNDGVADNFVFTCAVDTDAETLDWLWYSDAAGVPIMQFEESTATALGAAVSDSGMYGCHEEQLVPATQKYSPPAQFLPGFCPQEQCYQFNAVRDQGECVLPGTSAQGLAYFCQDFEGSGEWTHQNTRIAERLLAHTSGTNYILNCGQADSAQNLRPGEAPGFGFCQLAKISSGQSNEIMIGVAFSSSSEEAATTKLVEELQKTHEVDLETTDWKDLSYVHYDGELGIAYFTSADDLTSAGGTFWDKVRTFFGLQVVADEQLISRSAERIYLHGPTGYQAVAEFRLEPRENNADAKVHLIVDSNNEVYPYSVTRWREVIRQR